LVASYLKKLTKNTIWEFGFFMGF